MAEPFFTVWGRLNSHNVKKVVWFAEELGLDYARHDMGLKFGFSDHFLALNPNRLIPMIEDGKVALWESNTILRYMAAEYGGEAWFPRDPIDRALAERWMDWHFGYADAQRAPFLATARQTPDQWDRDGITNGIAACAKQLAVMEKYLSEKPWLSGDRFGIGDIPMGVYAYTWFNLKFAEFGIERPEFPAITDWYGRLTQRPGFAAQVMIPLT